MNRTKQIVCRLTQAVLASTFFVTHFAYADCNINAHNSPNAPPVLTSTCNTVPSPGFNVNILTTGDLQPIAGNSAIVLNTASSNVTILSGNHVGASAILVSGTPPLLGGGGIFTSGPGNYNISVGAGSGITAAHIDGNQNFPAINYFGQAVTGSIDNFGTITSDNNGGPTINLDTMTLTGSIFNNPNATISNTTSSFKAGKIPAAIAFNYPANVVLVGDLENAQGASITSTTQTAVLFSQGTITGGVINEGLILSLNTTGVGPGTIAAIGNVQITNGITNRGQISAPTALNTAVSLKATLGQLNSIKLIQDVGGSISGNVLLADQGSNGTGDPNVFDMNPDTLTITGGVTAANSFPNTLNLNGGTIKGDLNLGTNGDTVNLGGTSLQAIFTNDNGSATGATINVTGGSFTRLQGVSFPIGAPDTLNILNTFTFNGPGAIDSMRNIHVSNAGTVFTANNPITSLGFSGPLGTLTVDAQTTFDANANVTPSSLVGGGFNILNNGNIIDNTPATFGTGTGSTQNNGTLQVNLAKNLTTTTFNQSSTGSYVVQLQGSNTSSLITVGTSGVGGAAVLAKGSTIIPQLLGFIPNGSIFTILQTGSGGSIIDDSTLVYNSATVQIRKAEFPPNGPNGSRFGVPCGPGTPGDDRCIELIVTRTPASNFAAGNQQITCLTQSLDQIGASGAFANLFTQLNLIQDPQAATDSLDSLVPLANYTLSSVSHFTTSSNYDSVDERLFTLRGYRIAKKHKIHRAQEVKVVWPPLPDEYMEEEAGYGYGDFDYIPWNYSHWGLWGRGYGSYLNQNDRKHMEGYHAKVYGMVIGTDWGILDDCITFGIAGGYAHSFAKGKTFANKELEVSSYQATFYTWWEPWPAIYTDIMLSATAHKYDTIRDISINNAIFGEAEGSFHGFQYGVQADVGYVWNFEGYYITPLARVKSTHLGVEDYTEEGSAGVFNLSVQHGDVNELVGGVGIRLDGSIIENRRTYEPELSLMFMYDFMRNKERSQVNFEGGGSAFCANSVKPSPSSAVLGVGLNSLTARGNLFTLKYELEWRKQFFANSAYIQFNYEFA